jgi:hypothetical protein
VASGALREIIVATSEIRYDIRAIVRLDRPPKNEREPAEIGMYMRDSMRHWWRTLPRLDVIGMKKP